MAYDNDDRLQSASMTSMRKMSTTAAEGLSTAWRSETAFQLLEIRWGVPLLGERWSLRFIYQSLSVNHANSPCYYTNTCKLGDGKQIIFIPLKYHGVQVSMFLAWGSGTETSVRVGNFTTNTLKAYLSFQPFSLSAIMISNTHIVAQKPRGRRLHAKVCGSESAIFRILVQQPYLENSLSCYNVKLEQNCYLLSACGEWLR